MCKAMRRQPHAATTTSTAAPATCPSATPLPGAASRARPTTGRAPCHGSPRCASVSAVNLLAPPMAEQLPHSAGLCSGTFSRMIQLRLSIAVAKPLRCIGREHPSNGGLAGRGLQVQSCPSACAGTGHQDKLWPQLDPLHQGARDGHQLIPHSQEQSIPCGSPRTA